MILVMGCRPTWAEVECQQKMKDEEEKYSISFKSYLVCGLSYILIG